MPELPEVEVVRRGLADHVVGRTISTVDVLHERSVRRHAAGSADFAGSLAGMQIVGAHRRGKYLWLPLADGRAIVGHLGMSGQMLMRDASMPDETHLRIRFTFADGDPQLRFVDQRTFGGLAVTDTAEHGLPVDIAHIGLDPLDPDFDDDGFARAIRAKRSTLKRALLDQTLISGVGNIYADEALWRARLHYERSTSTLNRPQVVRLLAALREVMGDALQQGGTSFDRLYVNVNGESGYFDRSLNAYGREGLPCSRCGTAIRRSPFMNRSSHWCPRCQRRPRNEQGFRVG